MEIIQFSKATINLIIDAIRRKQIRFIQTLNKKDLVPLPSKDIAEEVGKDKSTVGRVANPKKIVLTDQVILYKELFTEPVIEKADGTFATQEILFEEIRDIVSSEDRKHPFTDKVIDERLYASGNLIARRTIAKYRIRMGIKNSNKRKRDSNKFQ